MRSASAGYVWAAVGLAPLVSAHGWIQSITGGSQPISGWKPWQDPWATQNPEKPMRKFKSDGPVTDVTSKAITCNTNGATMNVPVATTQGGFRAGGEVTFHWTNWPNDHKGPVMTYLADCRGDCSRFDGSQGNVWFKIDHSGFENGRWASERLISNGNTWKVKIPSSIAPGHYLLRHEILALHSARNLNGGQFYPSCTQIQIASSGTIKPSGVALPGAYSPQDPGILIDIWNGVSNYKIPGPDVYRDGGSAIDSSPRPAPPAAPARGGVEQPGPSQKEDESQMRQTVPNQQAGNGLPSQPQQPKKKLSEGACRARIRAAVRKARAEPQRSWQGAASHFGGGGKGGFQYHRKPFV